MPYPRLTNFNGTNSSDYLPLWQMPVAYNQPLSILITPILVEYHDEQRDLTFSGAKCEIDSLESKIGKLITVTLEVIPDSHELTLTLLLPKINLEGQKSSFATSAIRTKHLTSIGGPALVKGPLQTYDVLSLRGIASQGD